MGVPRCLAVAAMWVASAAAPEGPYAAQKASLEALRAHAPAAGESRLRAAVVLGGHPRTFLSVQRVRDNVINGVDALCATVHCDVFAVVAATDGSLFANPAPHARANAGDVEAAFRGLKHARIGCIVSAEDPHPAWRRDACDEDRRPALDYGRELAHVRAAWALVKAAEDGITYDVVLRLRFDVVWVRPPPDLLDILAPSKNDVVAALNLVVVPRHHFPVNNHVAVLGRATAGAYFDGPFALWRNCSEDWSRTPASLANPEGLLLKSLLYQNVAVRRVPLFATIFRTKGAECARLQAYRRGDARTVSRECTATFPAADPRSRTAPSEGQLIYEMADLNTHVVINPETHMQDIRTACDAQGGRTCDAHAAMLDELMATSSKARALRLIVWEDSFITSSRFADLHLNSLQQWADFELRPRAYLRVDVQKVVKEIGLEEALRRDATFVLHPNDTDCEAVVKGECTVDTLEGKRVAATLENWHFGDVGERAEVLCAWAGLDDPPCGRLHDLQRMRWRAARRGCVQASADVSGDVARPPLLSSVPPDFGGAPSLLAPAYADALLYKPPAPLGDPPSHIPMWTAPSEGVAAALAMKATAAWRAWGYGEGAVETAASDPDCMILQVLDGEVWVANRTLDHWDSELDERPWREQRRLAFLELVLELAPTIQMDVEVAFCPVDCVLDSVANTNGTSPYAHHGTAVHLRGPRLGLVACRGSQDIPVPAWYARSIDLDESLNGWDGLSTLIVKQRERYPYLSRDPRAVFRGKVLGKSCFDYDLEKIVPTDQRPLDSQPCGRRALIAVGAAHPALVDAAHDYVPLLAQEEYRYQIIAEGHCGWSDRLRLALFMGPLLLIQETACREFYGLALEPWVHYVPVDHAFATLASVVQWARDHPDLVRRMIRNAHAYAEHAVSAAAVRAYAAHVLRHLGKAARYVPVRRGDAVLGAPLLVARRAAIDAVVAEHARREEGSS